MSDKDTLKDYEEAHKQAISHWAPYLTEALKDLQFKLGKQWDPVLEQYLKSVGREALVFNKLRRVIKLVTGYQRKNRLSMCCNPTEGSDKDTASQFTGLLLYVMQQSNGYNVISDAFEKGPLITGVNLIEPYLDYSDDPLNGDIKIKRRPYNKFLLDPTTFERDLSDCNSLITRDFFIKNTIKSLLPSAGRAKLKDMKPTGIDGKFQGLTLPSGLSGENLFKYDQFWVRDTKEISVVVNPKTGAQKEWPGTKAQLNEALSLVYQTSGIEMKTIRGTRRVMNLHIIVDEEVMYSGSDPLKIDDFPFVPAFGFWTPEYDHADLKLQGLVRCDRDPQTEVNKRRSKMLDIIDSQISSGWIAEVGSVVNEKSLYQSGQGQVIWVNEHETKPIGNRLEKIRSADIPQGLFQLSEVLDRDVVEIPGANADLLGSPDNPDIQVAAMLSKLRSGQGLTVLQDLFDNLALSQKILGNKLIKIIQKNWDPSKVQRVINEQPTREFYNKDFGKYDCNPAEGLLTDSQRQMYHTQIFAYKQAGAPIPWSEVIETSPITDIKKLKEAVQREEQAMKQQAEAQAQGQKLQMAMLMAELQQAQANTLKDKTQAEENKTNAFLDRAKAVKEMQGVDFDQAIKVLELMRSISEQQNLGEVTA